MGGKNLGMLHTLSQVVQFNNVLPLNNKLIKNNMLKSFFKFLGFGTKNSTGGRVRPTNIFSPPPYISPENDLSRDITEKILKDLDLCPADQWKKVIGTWYEYTFDTLPYNLFVDDGQRMIFPVKYGTLTSGLKDVLTEKHQKEIYRKFRTQILDREAELSLKEQNELLQLFKLR